jgi:hypothetical protein
MASAFQSGAFQLTAFQSDAPRGFGGGYHHKTLSRIEREKAAAKARKRIAKRIKEATPEPTPYLAMWDAEISASLAEQPATADTGEQDGLIAREWAEQIARIDQMIWSAMVEAERQAEEDAAVLLLAM